MSNGHSFGEAKKMTIETERLILRPFLESDAEDVFEYLCEPAVNCFACMKLDTIEDARKEMKERVGETDYYFAIVLKETGKVIGEIDAYPEAGEPHADKNDPKDTFSPCWMLNKAYHGKGYAYEAARARDRGYARRSDPSRFFSGRNGSSDGRGSRGKILNA